MNIILKKTVKFAAGTCAALSLVAISSVVASGTAVKVVAAGLKAGKDAMKEQWDALRTESDTEAVTEPSLPAEEAEMFDDVGTAAGKSTEN